jgi:hypothetical protein
VPLHEVGKMNKLKIIAGIIGLSTLLSSYMCFAWIMFTAYYNGLTVGTFSSLVAFNRYGEAMPELLLILFTMPLVAIFSIYSVIEIKKEKRNNGI